MTWAQRRTVTLPILIHRAHQDKLDTKPKIAPRVLHAIEEGVWTDRYYLARAQVQVWTAQETKEIGGLWRW